LRTTEKHLGRAPVHQSETDWPSPVVQMMSKLLQMADESSGPQAALATEIKGRYSWFGVRCFMGKPPFLKQYQGFIAHQLF
jgi:hypothetical protein